MKYLSYIIITCFVISALFLCNGQITGGDSLELVLSSATLDIPHPTGYALYNLLGKIFSMVPLKNVIFRLEIMSLFFSVLTLIIFNKTLNEICPPGESLILTIALGFSSVFMSQSVIPEVYSLLMFFLAMSIYLCLKIYKSDPPGEKYFYLLSFIYGLALTHHLKMIFLLPLIALSFMKMKINKRRVIVAALFFILPLLLYLYFPVRAVKEPYLNFDNPVTLKNFLFHITGILFNKNLTAYSFSTFQEHFVRGFELMNEFSYIFSILLMISTVIIIFIPSFSDFKFFGTLMLCFIADAVFTLFYGIEDFEIYFITVYFYFLILTVPALLWINRRRLLRYCTITLILISFFISLPVSYKYCKLTKDNTYKNYLMNVINTLDSNHLLIANNIFPLDYLQQIEHKFLDVRYINKSLLPLDWYVKSITKRYPNIFGRGELKKSSDYDSYQDYLWYLSEKIIQNNIYNTNIYFNSIGLRNISLDLSVTEGSYFFVPYGLLYRVVPSTNEINPREIIDKNIRLWSGYDYGNVYKWKYFQHHYNKTVDKYADAFANTGDFFIYNELYDRAKNFYLIAVNLRNKYFALYYNLASIYRQAGSSKKELSMLDKYIDELERKKYLIDSEIIEFHKSYLETAIERKTILLKKIEDEQ